LDIDIHLSTQCENWVASNQKDLSILNQVASQSHIDTCQQYCLIAGSGFRADTTTCRTLCERAGGLTKFSSALAIDNGFGLPGDVCEKMFKLGEQSIHQKAQEQMVSMLEVSSQQQPAQERRLGIRGDLTIQGTLTAVVLTSPIGDVKVSGEMTVMNQIESSSARAATFKADSGLSVKDGIISKKEQLLVKGKIDADTVSVANFHTSFLEINGVRQWSLQSLEDFEETGTDGWSNSAVTECAGRHILGGHCVEHGKGEVSKTFTNLPPHTQIRINAKYMFIDSWDGESGFLKADTNLVWTESYNHADGDAKHGINLCGNETPERKFGRSIDVTVPHTQDSITLTFGATTDEHPCDESFGVDSVMLFTR